MDLVHQDQDERPVAGRRTGRWTRRLVVALALAAAAAVLLPGLGRTPLVDWDEGIYAEVARGVVSGNPWRLTWNGDAYDRKPPLLFWAIAASYRAFGVGEATARFPSALAGVLTVATVAAVAARRGAAAGLLSACFLLGSTLFVERGGRRACTDALVILFSVVALWRATERPGTWRARIEAGLATGLAILSKGPAGLLAPLALLLSAPRDRGRRRDCAAMLAVALALALPWYAVQLWLGGASFVASHVGFELVERTLRPIHGDGATWWYPLRAAWDGAGVWLALAVIVALARATSDPVLRREVAPWLCAAALALAGAMVMRTRLPWYPLPALPMLAVAGGIAAGCGRVARRSIARRAAFAVLALAALHSLASSGAARRAVIDEELQFEPFRALGARIASALVEEPFIGATDAHPTLVFYGGRPIRLYDEAELRRLLLDPQSLPRAGLVARREADVLLSAGAEEIAPFGDRVLLRFRPAPPTEAASSPRQVYAYDEGRDRLDLENP